MNDSLYLGRLFGIHIRVHLLFLVMMGVFVIIGGGQFALLMVMLFALVLLHELGHSLVAQSFGIRVLDITFWPLGGMARMNEIPESTRIEGWIAIAGPAVNFVLAALATPVYFMSGGTVEALGTLMSGFQSTSSLDLVGLFIVMNLVLGLFNLVPAFPMDGGRVLRALLGRNGDWVRATERAVAVGRFLALVMVFGGLLTFNCILPIIGVFVWAVGARELLAVRMRHGLNPFGGGRFAGGTPFEGLFETLGTPYASSESTRPGAETGEPAPPGLDEDQEPLMGSGGISDEDIERLERYRGRLR